MHVDDLLAELTPEEMDERAAYHTLSGAGEMRYIASQLLAQIANQITRLMLARGIAHYSANAFVGAEDYMPESMRRTQKLEARVSADDVECEAKLRRAVGF